MCRRGNFFSRLGIACFFSGTLDLENNLMMSQQERAGALIWSLFVNTKRFAYDFFYLRFRAVHTSSKSPSTNGT